MATTPSSSGLSPPAAPGVIVPYRMHVSQKYLDLTKQKLELTRLPREPQLPQQLQSTSLVTKADLEHLVDHWTEGYSWRAQEKYYNDTLPQYRVSIHGTRIHFVHRQSLSTSNVTPLLFIHGYPESFIAVSNMINDLCDPVRTPPRGSEDTPAFHVVAPSIPGFGFSDHVAEDGNNLVTTAEMFDGLMKTLGYHRYIIHGSGWGFRIARLLALTHSESCIGIHTANPGEMPTAIQVPGMSPPGSQIVRPEERAQIISYALCDSPAGLLAYIVDAIAPSLRTYPSPPGIPAGLPNPWTPTALINWTMLHWLPGPESALRWLENSTTMLPNLWTSFSNIPLAVSLYEDTQPSWVEGFHTIAMVRRRAGPVRFAAWERPAEVVHDIRDMARMLVPQYPVAASFGVYPPGSGY